MADGKITVEGIEEIEHIEIPLSDGCKLSAKLWIPEEAKTKKLPAILEYIPYRKRDVTSIRDSKNHRYFASYGYVSVRVDTRGSGESEGVLTDEYLELELQDGIEILNWIEKQSWSDGNVGMIGLSWGGFNGLQLAARNPKQLKAIITVCSSDERYSDDVHYMGGCLLTDNISWASVMFSHNSCPPDPKIVGEKWKNMWLDRLEGSGLWLKNWLEHPLRDEYWRHASVAEDYNHIKCPVYAVSGWADGYTNSVFRLIENLEVPRKGVVGPWGHKYPQAGVPGTGIGFLHDCVRWWDRWLKQKENGVENDPNLQVWLQDSFTPNTLKRPGKWLATRWDRLKEKPKRNYYLSYRGLSEDPSKEKEEIKIQSPLSAGLFAGKWCSYHAESDLPGDQRKDDGGATVFETNPLKEDLEILGSPKFVFEISSNKPVAMIAARLSDVAPDGRATRVTFGLLNLTHNKDHTTSIPLEPGKKYQFELDMNYVAQRFRKGHRLRLSLSTSYWPLAWPSPEPVTFMLSTHKSRMEIPLLTDTLKDPSVKPNEFMEKETAKPVPHEILVPAHREWKVSHNITTDEEVLHVINNDPKERLPHSDITLQRKVTETYSVAKNDVATLRAETITERTFEREGWNVQTVAKTVMTSTKDYFLVLATLDAYHNEARIFSKTWDEKIPRNGC